jgi:hypothetical protein
MIGGLVLFAIAFLLVITRSTQRRRLRRLPHMLSRTPQIWCFNLAPHRAISFSSPPNKRRSLAESIPRWGVRDELMLIGG